METVLTIIAIIILIFLWLRPNFDYIMDIYNQNWLIMWYSPTPWSTVRKYIAICQVDDK